MRRARAASRGPTRQGLPRHAVAVARPHGLPQRQAGGRKAAQRRHAATRLPEVQRPCQVRRTQAAPTWVLARQQKPRNQGGAVLMSRGLLRPTIVLRTPAIRPSYPGVSQREYAVKSLHGKRLTIFVPLRTVRMGILPIRAYGLCAQGAIHPLSAYPIYPVGGTKGYKGTKPTQWLHQSRTPWAHRRGTTLRGKGYGCLWAEGTHATAGPSPRKSRTSNRAGGRPLQRLAPCSPGRTSARGVPVRTDGALPA